jgi:hypothetical protein
MASLQTALMAGEQPLIDSGKIMDDLFAAAFLDL